MLIQAPRLFNARTRYAHSMCEISGTEITVTRDTSVVQLKPPPPTTNGQRATGDYTGNSGNLEFGDHIDSAQRLSRAVHACALESGMAGLMSGGAVPRPSQADEHAG